MGEHLQASGTVSLHAAGQKAMCEALIAEFLTGKNFALRAWTMKGIVSTFHLVHPEFYF